MPWSHQQTVKVVDHIVSRWMKAAYNKGAYFEMIETALSDECAASSSIPARGMTLIQLDDLRLVLAHRLHPASPSALAHRQ
jgi:hypothetical protein